MGICPFFLMVTFDAWTHASDSGMLVVAFVGGGYRSGFGQGGNPPSSNGIIG